MSKQNIKSYISTSWDTNFNKFNSWINWSSVRLNKERLTDIASILGGYRLGVIMQNYAENYKYWNHGMPDLILWNASTVKFSEVKSETDRLSEVQKAWIAFLSQHEIYVDVCYVNRDMEKAVEVFDE